MRQILETERLRLREFNLEDAKFIVALLNSSGWLQFIGERNVRNEEQAKNYLEQGPIRSYHEYGYGLARIETKKEGIPIGMCGIKLREELENPELGYALLPQFWGQGYALEIVEETIKHAKNEWNIPVISAITDVANLKSIRLLEKVGMKFCKKIKLSGLDKDLMLFNG